MEYILVRHSTGRLTMECRISSGFLVPIHSYNNYTTNLKTADTFLSVFIRIFVQSWQFVLQSQKFDVKHLSLKHWEFCSLLTLCITITENLFKSAFSNTKQLMWNYDKTTHISWCLIFYLYHYIPPERNLRVILSTCVYKWRGSSQC